ncbi:WXG100 family type VII secretion target [Actinomadura sp. DC4]|uniref:WXG100 family type VII secretion target n=1 Tax=Actinomadura sp. DC4 TaxID=3055069 RepID=UPI0025B0E007|nr:WXG100 family type VII secretion target [Actinomadura sp. DC4]MDN3354768.1 WXG100 family type VII secretion target [Actinomadura sp. DC4]
MGSRLMLNRQAAHDDKAELVRLDGLIRQELDDLDKDVKNNLDYENWKDTARTEYDHQQNIWNAAADAMNTCLNDSHTTLNNMLDNVDLTEQQNLRSWQNVYG